MFLEKIRNKTTGYTGKFTEGAEKGFRKVFKDKKDLDITNGDIRYNLFYLSLPIVVLNLLRTAYNIVDMFWLGQLSKNALAAITFAFPVIFFLISLGIGLAVAGSVLVAQNEGAGRKEEAEKTASQTITFSFLASIIIGGIGYLTVGKIIAVMGAAPKVAAMGTGYLQIISIGIFAMFGFSVFIALMRGYGDTVTPMLLMLGTVILNMILDPLLIFGWGFFPRLEMQGAAIATIFSRLVAFGVGLAILLTGKKGLKIKPEKMIPDPEYLIKMVKIGVPASAEGVGSSIAVNIMMVIVGAFSTAVVAGFGVGIRIFSLIFLPAIAVGKGVETMTGQNIGAGNFTRAKKSNFVGAKYMFLLLTLLGAAIYFNRSLVVSIFTKNTEVIEVGEKFLLYLIPGFGFSGVYNVMKGGFRGAGKTLIAAVISITMLGIIRLPIAHFLSRSMGPEGIYIAFPASAFIGALLVFLWFRKEKLEEKTI